MTATPQPFADLTIEAGRVFNPNTPINEKDLFAGRQTQVLRLLDVIGERGQHAVLYGERGVGKTSLANVLSQFLVPAVIAPRVACDQGDTFDSVWRKLFDKIELIRSTPKIGYGSTQSTLPFSSTELLGPDEANPGSVNRALHVLGRTLAPILIIDEFDRLSPDVRHGFADTIKSLADDDIEATVILVGVGDSADQLVQDHQSVGRTLIQVELQRMSRDEIVQIVLKGVDALGMTISEDAIDRIVLLSQGLPHYAHLMGRHGSRKALAHEELHINLAHIHEAIEKAIVDAQQTISTAYHNALASPRKHNLFGDVLLACALAELDARGTFAAQDVRLPLQTITGRDYDIPTFAQHLNEFSDQKRGYILTKLGETRRYRFRFSDALMQPYVIMQGVLAGKIPDGMLK